MRKAIAAAIAALTLIAGASVAGADTPDHTVREGDSIAGLAGPHWRYACVVNAAAGRLTDCDLLTVGQLLRVTVPADERGRIDAWFSVIPAPPRRSDSARGSAPAPVRSSGGWAIPTYIVECESGGDYRAENPTSSASGAYQIIDGTWAAYGGRAFGYSHAADAPPAVQDEIARRIYAAEGADPWVCG